MRWGITRMNGRVSKLWMKYTKSLLIWEDTAMERELLLTMVWALFLYLRPVHKTARPCSSLFTILLALSPHVGDDFLYFSDICDTLWSSTEHSLQQKRKIPLMGHSCSFHANIQICTHVGISRFHLIRASLCLGKQTSAKFPSTSYCIFFFQEHWNYRIQRASMELTPLRTWRKQVPHAAFADFCCRSN